ncbi:putative LRR and NB-ARC domains-containing disease resistance protein [Tripterygium wilfordii]|uniref:Putative LRR and NB-ARC domains-containing disease resistance protein n=1 Tax=Tripterygium wilfordii TaxID=458696 RepID=A0A7J7D1F1_TRIWF|nr:putative LRR and NB-ARC domains-containing disease resistance protein [Tripterygium wilfordii]
MRESVKILLNMMVFFGREEIKLLLEYATGSDNGDWKGISKEADFIVVILSSKRAPRNDYKGKNCKPTGFHTRKGIDLTTRNNSDIIQRMRMDDSWRCMMGMYKLFLNLKINQFKFHNDDKNEMLVLQSLQPHRNLKRLTISFYGGSEFPYWVGDPMSSKLLCLNLRHCRKIRILPPLGQLCFLKELSIDGLDGLETIGPEFFGSDLHSVEPFRSLETLEIKNMSEWREWSHFFGVQQADVRFPNLQRLVLQNCPKLIGNLPSRLPCGLTHICVEDCDALESFPIVDSSTGRQCLLKELEIRNCYSLKYFDRNFNFPSSLTRLTIVNCRNLVFLPDGLMLDVGVNDSKSHSHLEYLEISGCPLIPSFPTGKFPAALNELRIGGMMRLGSITGEMFHENNVLERVEIWNNDTLRALPSINSMRSLGHLSINNCPALESFPKMGLAIPTLRYLAIQNCPNLLSLPKPELSHLPSLRTFIMSNCRGVVSLTEEGGLPPNLTTLQVRDCENLRQPMAEWGLRMLSSLEILQVDGICDAVANVVSFLDDGGCLLPASLYTLWMGDFMNLESISMGLQMLTSLTHLVIQDCPKLQSFPKEAIPPSLLRINMCGCPLLKGDYMKLKNGEDRPTVEFF